MSRLFKAFLFKLSKDLTFRITLIIGGALALFITLVYLLIDATTAEAAAEYGGTTIKYFTGPNMLFTSMSPVNNFGLALPINLITFICLEFTQGTIRNKIIAGHSKIRIYISLCLSGLVFTFALLLVYMGILVSLGTIFGGFDLTQEVMTGLLGYTYVDVTFIMEMVLICILFYATLVFFTVFFATLFRSIGPCIPVVIVTLLILYTSGVMITTLAYIPEVDTEGMIIFTEAINPLYVLTGGYTTITKLTEGGMDYYAQIETRTLITTCVSNLVYSGIFFVGGFLIFGKRDVK